MHLSVRATLVGDFSFVTSMDTSPRVQYRQSAHGETLAAVSAFFNGPFVVSRSTRIGQVRFVRRGDAPISVEPMWQISSGAFPGLGQTHINQNQD
jgi:hypothetical protein